MLHINNVNTCIVFMHITIEPKSYWLLVSEIKLSRTPDCVNISGGEIDLFDPHEARRPY